MTGEQLQFLNEARAGGIVRAPWTHELVSVLNAHQHCRDLHPYTCGSGHRKEHPDGEGVLVATVDGWECPHCDYRQDWC